MQRMHSVTIEQIDEINDGEANSCKRSKFSSSTTFTNNSSRLQSALQQVRREMFVPSRFAETCYDDMEIPLGYRRFMDSITRTISLLEAADINSDDLVLDVGTGSGYCAALLSHCASHVVSVDSMESFLEEASDRLNSMITQRANVRLLHGDPYLGCHDESPYDAIVVANAVGHYVPISLIEQLKPGGRLVVARINMYNGQPELIRITRLEDGTLLEESTP